MTIRDEVIEHLIETMRAAEDQGLDGSAAARTAFPGTPDSVLCEAWWELQERKTEAWWTEVEKTIDGEIVRAALQKGGRA